VLSASRYLLGVAEIGMLVGAAGLGGARVRARLLPGLSGSPAWLAAALVAIAILLGCAELLGAVGLFEPLPYLLAILAVGLGLRAGLAAGRPHAHGPAPPDPGLGMRLCGLAIAAVVIAHFCVGLRLRLSTGMTGFDTTWYHAPFAADFAQSGRTFELNFIAPQFLAWFYPQSSELLHGVGILAFSRDLLSPLLNLGWLGGCLLAAWCIGRPYGAAPVSLAGAALALGSGAFADQAGEARNDMVALFFVLTAVAIVLNAADRPGTAPRRPGTPAVPGGAVVLAGLSIGLAAGTKVNYLAAALALVGTLALIAPRGERLRALATGGLPALAGCGFWYLRNLVHAGSPLPWVKHLGPLSLPAPEQAIGGREGFGVLHYLSDPGVWSDWFAPGLHQGFGVLWPAILVAGLGGALLCLGRASEPVLRACATVVLALIVAWLVAPASASGPDGEPLGFLSGLRYLVPALALGLALLPLAPKLRWKGARWALLASFALGLPFTVASGDPWYSGYLAGAALAGVLAVGLAVLIGSRWPSAHRRAAIAAASAAAILIVAAGERGQRTYLENRYSEPGFTAPGLDAAFRRARSISGARIATTSTRQYPLFGTDLSNRVRFVGLHRPHGGFVRPSTCRSWRRALNEGGYEYVVASRDRMEPGRPAFPPEAGWTASDPAARVVLRKPPTVVFRLQGRLDPSQCP
jgi:hypothetical protein